jgi:hypothetical protein
LFFTVDGGQKWVPLYGGAPPMQVRDIQIQRRHNDVVMGTFGNGFWILDDYSALREVSATALNEEARLFPLRNAFQFTPWGLGQDGSAGLGPLGGNFAFPNPPNGAVFTYNVGQALPDDAQLVIDITDGANRRVRRMPLSKDLGLRRAVWNLSADPGVIPGEPDPALALSDGDQAQGQAQQGQTQQGQGQGRAGAQAGAPGRGAGGAGAGGQGGGGGRGGRGGGGTAVPPGRFRAQLGKVVGETFTPLGPAQFFQVVPLPERNYQLYR